MEHKLTTTLIAELRDEVKKIKSIDTCHYVPRADLFEEAATHLEFLYRLHNELIDKLQENGNNAPQE